MNKYALSVSALVILAMAGAVFGDTLVTYCVNSSIIGINDTFEICGNSPVLNPASLNCQNYTRHMEEVCAAGCDPKTSSCTPLPMERLYIIVGVIILVLGFIVYLARRYG